MKKYLAAIFMVFYFISAANINVFALGRDNTDYVLGKDRTTQIPIPLTYKVTKVIDWFGEEHKSLKAPEDLFIDKKSNLYIVDTGNNRIIKQDDKGNVVFVYHGPPDRPLKSPKGIFVADYGDMFIADSDNHRILHVSQEGNFIEEFVKPDSDLLSNDMTFDPAKVFVSNMGYIYMIKGQQFLTIDSNNRFRGFVGANEVAFSFQNMLVRLFATEKQKQKITKVMPPPYSNFLIHDNDMVYAVGLGNLDQIKVINSVGKNIYKRGFYGEYSIAENGRVLYPQFVDLAVDKNGIISALESNTGNIYQYDPEGNLLTVFGGKGNTKGYFQLPSSIVADANGNLYVLDKSMGNIQVFTPTSFIVNVHEALGHYLNGNYVESEKSWMKVIENDANYPLARIGVGKAKFKSGNYRLSMKEYRKALDKDGYSKAFSQYRHELIRNRFPLVVAVLVVAVVTLAMLYTVLKKKAGSYEKEFLQGRWRSKNG